MQRTRNFFSATLALVLTIATISAGFSAGAQQRAYRVSEQQVDQLLGRIESRSSQFRRSLYDALNRTPIDGTRQEDNINEFVRSFETATATLRDRFRGRRDVADDVREVLNRAAYIDSFMRRHNLSASPEEDWRALRSDLDVLADYYNVTWGWDNNASTPGRGTPGRDWPGRNSAANRLTGTYRLDATRSDDVWRVAQRTTRGISEEERQRLRNLIERRLAAPEMLAIERRGRNVLSHPPALLKSLLRRTERTGSRKRAAGAPCGSMLRLTATNLWSAPPANGAMISA